METLTISINNASALKTLQELEEKHFISIKKHKYDSPAIPGEELSMSQFRKWVYDAELSPTVSHEDAKSIWLKKRNQLHKNIL